MHFAVFNPAGCGGALMNVSVSLAAGLALRQHTVDLITLQDEPDEVRGHYRFVAGLELVNVVPLRVSSTKMSLLALMRVLRRRRPDVLFSQLLRSNCVAIIACRLARMRTRTVLLEGTLISEMSTVEANAVNAKEAFSMRCAPYLVRALYPRADGIVAKSAEVLEDLRRHLGSSAHGMVLTQLPNPYVFDRIRALAREPVDWPWDTAVRRPVILSVGRLAIQKGYDVLFRAVARIRRTIPCHLAILGDGPDRQQLLSLAAELGLGDSLWLPGRVENPWKFMADAEIFALPSRWEGWSSALTEAAALGRAITVTDRALSGNAWLEDEQSALMVRAEDVEGLSESLYRMLRDPDLRARLGEAAQTAAQPFDYRSIASRYERFASDLADPASRSTQPHGDPCTQAEVDLHK